ncbi:hypothetical protein OQA88_4708 [Cercophora sp. LCS_1]
MAQTNIVEGVFAINKPMGMSSAQVIRDCQNFFNPSKLFAPLIHSEKDARAKESNYQKNRRRQAKKQIQVKIGHGGTLDPLATGVLILGVGKGTKTLQNFLTCTKTYEAVVLFGASTDSYDRTGRIIKKANYDEITRPAVEKALEGFRGKFKQIPPLFSALKMNGKPLYEYAREGKPIPREIETRDVEVSELGIVEWYEPGTHNHRWPTEEAEQAEKNLVDSVWRVAKRQSDAETEPEKLTEEQKEGESKALADYESTKREAEERVDGLVVEEQPPKKRRKVENGAQGSNSSPVMSGALGKLPPPGRGSNLVPPPPSADTPPPWEGKGPPAVKIRMTVTSGFYVRSLCHDLGEKLGSAACMAELARTRQSDFVLGSDNCIEYDDILQGEDHWGPKVEKALDMWNKQNNTQPRTVELPNKQQGKKPTPDTNSASEAKVKVEVKEPAPQEPATSNTELTVKTESEPEVKQENDTV